MLALAAYRVARMLAMEEGPFGLFRLFRAKVDPKQSTWIGRGINCPLCLGFWVSFALYGLYQINYVNWIVVALAVAGAQVALQKVFG